MASHAEMRPVGTVDDAHPDFLKRARFAAWALLCSWVGFVIADLSVDVPHPVLLWSTRAARQILFMLFIVILYYPIGRRHVTAIAFLGSLAVLVASALIGIARGDSASLRLLCGLIPMTTAGLFPWGAIPQAFLVLASILVFAAHTWIVTSELGGAFPTHAAINLTAAWIVSLYLVRDITRTREAIGQARDQLRELNATLKQRVADQVDRLERTNKDLNSVAHAISHDLRLPLRSIDGFAAILLEEHSDTLDDTGRKHLSTVRNAAQRMGGLIDALLSLTRIGRHEPQRDGVKLSKIAAAIADELRSEEPGRKVVFSIAETPPVFGDAPLLRTLMYNLFENAWKYSEGRDPARIEFKATQINDETVYQISDNGIGFDMRYADKLFVTFEQLQGPTEFEGTGIGLAVVHKVIELHGGRVWGEGVVDGGAVFSFVLPVPALSQNPAA